MMRYINRDMYNFVMSVGYSGQGVTMWCCLERTGGNNNQKKLWVWAQLFEGQ